jgi:hypothetical protein
MEDHHTFILKGIDQPEPLDVSISAKTIRCATFKVIIDFLIQLVHELNQVLF